MAKLLTIVSLILVIVLFPPASLALISNNAVPGDRTYPIKRGLEDIIYAIASLHPVTRAWFLAARSDRRFKEITILVDKGKSVSKTLDELISQTGEATKEIVKVEDLGKKKDLLDQMSKSIQKYDQGLKEASEKLKETAPATITPTPQPPFQPIIEPPAQELAPSPPPPTPTPVLTPPPPSNQEELESVERARRELEQIRRRIGEERKRAEEELRKAQQQKKLEEQKELEGQERKRKEEEKKRLEQERKRQEEDKRKSDSKNPPNHSSK